MKIVNLKLRAEFKKPGRCAWCGTPCMTRDCAHVFSRGANGSDIRCNLVSLCRFCHSKSHAGGDPDQAQLLMVVRKREDEGIQRIVDVINFIRYRLDKSWSQDRIVEALGELPPETRRLCERELKEANVIS